MANTQLWYPSLDDNETILLNGRFITPQHLKQLINTNQSIDGLEVLKEIKIKLNDDGSVFFHMFPENYEVPVKQKKKKIRKNMKPIKTKIPVKLPKIDEKVLQKQKEDAEKSMIDRINRGKYKPVLLTCDCFKEPSDVYYILNADPYPIQNIHRVKVMCRKCQAYVKWINNAQYKTIMDRAKLHG